MACLEKLVEYREEQYEVAKPVSTLNADYGETVLAHCERSMCLPLKAKPCLRYNPQSRSAILHDTHRNNTAQLVFVKTLMAA